MKTIIFFTILNSICILIIFMKLKVIDVTVQTDKTFFNKTLTGYDIWINRFHIRIPIRNKRKTELREEVTRMISQCEQNKLQSLTAKFSWLKTWKEVRQFEKDYSVVDRKVVEKLVRDFTPKK